MDERRCGVRIILDQEYLLKGDADQIALFQTRVAAEGGRAGEIVETPVGYFRDMPDALEAYVKRCARTSGVTTVRQYILMLEKLRDDVRRLVEKAA